MATELKIANKNVAELEAEATHLKSSDPGKSALLQHVISMAKARPGFNPKNAISASAKFHLAPAQQSGENER